MRARRRGDDRLDRDLELEEHRISLTDDRGVRLGERGERGVGTGYDDDAVLAIVIDHDERGSGWTRHRAKRARVDAGLAQRRSDRVRVHVVTNGRDDRA